MKKILTFMAIAAWLLTAAACSELRQPIDLQENDYQFDVTKLVTQNFLTIGNEGTDDLKLNVNAPFPCTILKGDFYKCDNTNRHNNEFSISIDEVPIIKVNGILGQYTREITTVYIKPLELQKIKGYPAGFFAYPVRIRQYGKDGTIHISGEQLRKWKNDRKTDRWDGDHNQHYLKGIVQSVSTKYTTNGIHKPNSTIGETWLVPANRGYYTKENLPQLEALDAVVLVDGEPVNLTIHQFACYRLFENFNLKAGDTVEMNIPNGGIAVDAENPTTIWVTPQDFVINNN